LSYWARKEDDSGRIFEVKAMPKCVSRIVVLALILSIGYSTEAVGQYEQQCVDLWKACYSGECDSLRVFQRNGRCLNPAGKYLIRADEDGLFIRTDEHGSYDIISGEIGASLNPGMQGIYTIRKNNRGTFISTDKLGDFRIAPGKISAEEARVRAQQDAEWEEMVRDTARRDAEETKARMMREEEEKAEGAKGEAEEVSEEASEKEKETEQEESEEDKSMGAIVVVPPPSGTEERSE
jgi:hypothetical protein